MPPAAKPSATYKGYLLGGLSWFAVPFCMATAMGLGARALDLPLTAGEASAGLVPPAVAVHLMGAGGEDAARCLWLLPGCCCIAVPACLLSARRS